MIGSRTVNFTKTVCCSASLLMIAFFSPMAAHASSQVQTVAIGVHTSSIAIDGADNKVFVANAQNASILVIDDAKQNITDTIALIEANSPLTVRSSPTYMAVDSVTKKIYVTYDCTCQPSYISIINVTSGKIMDRVQIPFRPSAIAINSQTNKIYAAFDKNVTTVIDGSKDRPIANITTTEPVRKVGANSVTNTVYLTSSTSNKIFIFDGLTNRIIANVSIPLNTDQFDVKPNGANITDIAVNPETNAVYVVAMWSFPGSSDTVGLGMPPGFVTIINGSSNKISESNIVVNTPTGIAIDSAHNRAFISEYYHRDVLFLDQLANGTKTYGIPLGEGNYPTALAVNPGTGNLYTATSGTYSVLVLGTSELQTPEFPAISDFIVAGIAILVVAILRKRLHNCKVV